MNYRDNRKAVAAGSGWLSHFIRDKRGNTLAMVAAGLVPMAAMIGGAVDISRGYLAKARLQQACDAGALAARKELGGSGLSNGSLPSSVRQTARNFFDINYADGSYGTENIAFAVRPTADGDVEGDASVTVPTTIMKIFGKPAIDLDVDCIAELSISNVDIMFVLDTTGSMSSVNPGDTSSRISGLKSAVKDFYDELQDAATDGAQVRYGFVPYSSTVNVGRILPTSYVLGGTAGETWDYESRIANFTTTYNNNPVSGPEYEPHPGYVLSYNYCKGFEGTKWSGGVKIETTARTVYWGRSGGTNYYFCYLTDTVTDPDNQTETQEFSNWTYKTTPWPVRDYYQSSSSSRVDVPSRTPGTNRTSYWNGCIEESNGVAQDSWPSIPSNAYDMQIDLIPTTRETKWRPMWPEVVYQRGRYSERIDSNERSQPSGSYAACPTTSRTLRAYPRQGNGSRNTSFNDYVNSLSAEGATFHDIGMIWGARMISPTGIFRNTNETAPNGEPIQRHILFMTDGEMATNIDVYSAWSVEEMSGRVWGKSNGAPSGINQLSAKHTSRMLAICQAVKNKNISIWVVAFGTSLTTDLQNCADEGKSFQADNSAQLSNAFRQIASRIAELRLTQ